MGNCNIVAAQGWHLAVLYPEQTGSCWPYVDLSVPGAAAVWERIRDRIIGRGWWRQRGMVVAGDDNK